MHISITKSETGNNKGSCSRLVSYLEKENSFKHALRNGQEFWFNQLSRTIQPYEVRTKIDGNVAKLSKDDAKFFLVNISPSQTELQFLKEKFGAAEAREKLKNYADQVMDAYALNFRRPGVSGNSDLLYFGKLECNRYYTFKDLEVRQGRAKKGDIKPGEQSHVQIIVSRKDMTNRIKLSPLNNSRGTNEKHSRQVGQFDRVAFKQQAEKIFDNMFNYERRVEQSFKYANIIKHGNSRERAEVNILLWDQEKLYLSVNGNSKNFLDILLPNENAYQQQLSADEQFKRRRKKGRRQKKSL